MDGLQLSIFVLERERSTFFIYIKLTKIKEKKGPVMTMTRIDQTKIDKTRIDKTRIYHDQNDHDQNDHDHQKTI
jgi:hypothetical protein